MTSDCAREIAGMPMPATSAVPAALLISARRDRPSLWIICNSSLWLVVNRNGCASHRDCPATNCIREGHVNLGIKGLRVLVTAGAGGIGLEIARAFLAEGAQVHVCDVDAKALRTLGLSDPKITRSKADVSDRKQVAKLFKEALATLKGLDVLVNNAGIAGPTGKGDEIAPEDWDRTLAIDITGQFNCARLAVPHLRKSKNASIVNLSSAAGRLGFPLRSPYAASKWAVVGFSKSLAIELGPSGIRVNAIQPGIVAG